MSTKEKIPIYLPPELRERVDSQYKQDDCSSRTQFIEKAITFYLEYLILDESTSLLPNEVLLAIENRLGQFENRMASLMFKYSVELDMMGKILAPYVELSEMDLNSLRGKSIRDIKRTQGRISFLENIKQERTF